MENLNRLLLAMMLGGGASLTKGGSLAEGVAPVAMQALGAKSKVEMLRSLLGEGWKLNMDKDNMSLKGPVSALSTPQEQIGLRGPSGTAGVGPVSGITQAPAPTPAQGGGPDLGNLISLINFSPSPLGDFSYADLAGLTSEDVSQAFGGALDVERFKQKRLTDIADTMYKQQLIRESAARTSAMGVPKPPEPLDEPFPIEVPGVGEVTVRQWNALPREEQAYAAYVHQARQQHEMAEYTDPGVEAIAKGLRPGIMSREEFRAEVDKSDRESYLEALMEDPAKMAAEKELRRTEQPPQRRPLMTWTTATNELTKRFGKLDPTGMWAVTPELQSTHRRGQELLAKYKRMDMDPLEAVNRAENEARAWIAEAEDGYRYWVEQAQRIKDKNKRAESIRQLQENFKRQYGYIP